MEAQLQPGAEDAGLAIGGRQRWLRPDVKIQPLVDRWPAWPHLLAPAQQALNLAFRYVPALESFVAAPDVHVAASRDPDMYGGPFVDLPAPFVDSVKSYLAEIEISRAEALAFARQFRAFDQNLLAAATGYCLNDFREQAPEVLRGRVELVYDLNHQPKAKVIEEMMTIDDLGLGSAQAILIHDGRDDERPFFLSTPVLDPGKGLICNVELGSDAVRMLSEAKTKPIEVAALASLLNVHEAALNRFFTDEAPPLSRPFDQNGMRIRYFGHACVLLESRTCTVLIDPTFAVDQYAAYPHLLWHDLPERIDHVIISHGHQDHMCIEALMFLRHRVGEVIVPRGNSGDLSDPSLMLILRQLGFVNIRETAYLETTPTRDGSITTLPFSGEHCDLDVRGKQCFVVRIGGCAAGFFIDSDAIDIDVYGRISPFLEDIDVLFVGMECNGAPLSWLYGPLITAGLTKKNDNSRRLSGANSGQAIALVDLVRPQQAYVYAMGQEGWMRHLMGLNYKEDSIQLIEARAFVDQCRSRGLDSELLLGEKEVIIVSDKMRQAAA
jgi:L-ascorbate metabolism protein UlaG (beta-lactamase superfamily)